MPLPLPGVEPAHRSPALERDQPSILKRNAMLGAVLRPVADLE
jgi:hypothetical protein